MKNRFINFTMSIIIMLLMATFGIFGLIIYDEIENININTEEEVNAEIGDFQTTFQDKDTVESDIETPNVVAGSWDEINLGNTDVEEVDYSNVQINSNKYFYNQLEEDAKTIYKALETNKENMKTGTYKIALGNSFASLLNSTDGSTKIGEYYQSAIEAFIYDNADIFYLSPNKMYLKITQYSNNKYDVWIDNGEQPNYLIEGFNNEEQVNEAINQIEQVKNSILSNRSGNTLNDIKMVHDYLVDNIEYDRTISKQNIYDVYGALVKHEAVCEGYARAFKYLMDEMGVPCVIVMGKGTNSQEKTENHAWNYVQINGKWYAVDATWDDPIIIGGGSANTEIRYKFYLRGSSTMQEDHQPSGQFTPNGKIFSYPPLSSEDY